MRRCFIGLAVAPATREALAAAVAELSRLPRSAARRLRLVKSQNLHLTLKFLGDTPDETVAQLSRALAEVCRAHPRPNAQVAGRGAFPSRQRPRVLFAGLGAGRDAIGALASDLDQACAALGFSTEAREPTPHVTLARVEGPAAGGPLADWLADTTAESFGPLDERAVVLFESHLTPAGSRYERLAELPLGGA